MDIVSVMMDRDIIMKQVILAFKNASENIFIATPLLNVDILLSLMKNVDEKVQVNILVSSGVLTKGAILPSNCTVRIVDVKPQGPNLKSDDGKIKSQFLFWNDEIDKIFSKSDDPTIKHCHQLVNRPNYDFNQSYILVNGLLFFGGSLFSNLGEDTSYCPTFIGRASPAFVKFSWVNWNNLGIIDKQSWSENIQAQDITIVPGYEHDLLCQMIRDSKEYVYIETSTFISHNGTINRVASTIVERLVKVLDSGFENDLFKCIILVNTHHNRPTLFESGDYINEKINYTLNFIKDKLSEYCEPGLFANRIIIGRVKNSVIGSTIFIQDGKKCLLSSGSLCDRSLAKKNIELGLLITDAKKIEVVKNYSWEHHVKLKTGSLVEELFESCQIGNENVEKFPSWMSTTDPTRLSRIENFKQEDIILKFLLSNFYYT